MGKSSWVHSRTQGLFPLVVDGTVYHGYCKNCFSLVVDEEWDRGHGPSILVCLGCFCWTWSSNWHVFKPCVWWFQNYVASATKFELCVVITLFVLRCMLNYLRTLCNMWHVCWMLVMFWGPSRHSMDYQVYMGSSMIAWPLRWLTLYLCSYKLVGSTTDIALTEELEPVNEPQARPTPTTTMASLEPNPGVWPWQRSYAAGTKPYPHQATVVRKPLVR